MADGDYRLCFHTRTSFFPFPPSLDTDALRPLRNHTGSKQLVAYAGTAFAMGNTSMIEEFGCSREVATLGLSVYVVVPPFSFFPHHFPLPLPLPLPPSPLLILHH
jgi:hypothetical protein